MAVGIHEAWKYPVSLEDNLYVRVEARAEGLHDAGDRTYVPSFPLSGEGVKDPRSLEEDAFRTQF